MGKKERRESVCVSTEREEKREKIVIIGVPESIRFGVCNSSLSLSHTVILLR